MTIRTSRIVVMIIPLMFLLLLRPILSDDTFALSPSFARQGIVNNNNQWSINQVPQSYTLIDFPPGFIKLEKNTDECKMNQRYPRPPGISAVTYISNGKTLNATYWLSDPLAQPPPNAGSWLHAPFREIPWYNLGYYMSIHIHSAYDTGSADYDTGLEWNVRNESWTKTVEELSPTGDYRVLNEKFNYSLPLGKKYIDLSLNLENMNYPSIYDILFYAFDNYVKDGRFCRMIDVASRVYVPPPEFSITANPSTVTLRPGGEANVELKVQSKTDIKSQVSLALNSLKDIHTSVVPNETYLSSNGIVTPILNIKASENPKPHPYTISILANFSIPTEVRGITSTVAKTLTIQRAHGANTAFTTQISNLTVTVLPPFTADQLLRNFYNSWISPIGGIWTFLAGVGAVILPLIIRTYGAKNKNKTTS